MLGFTEYIAKDTERKVVNFAHQKMNETEFVSLFSAMVVSSHITHLYLGSTSLASTLSIEALSNYLACNSTLKYLSLFNNNISDFFISQILKPLERHTTIETIDISNTGLNADSMSGVRSLLIANTSLTLLDLSGNAIHSAGVRYIAKGLKRNTTLKHLKLSFCFLKDEGLIHIGNALKTNSSLHSIELGNNLIAYRNLDQFCLCLESNISIKAISLSNTGFSSPNVIKSHHIDMLEEVAQNNPQILYLECDQSKPSLIELTNSRRQALVKLEIIMENAHNSIEPIKIPLATYRSCLFELDAIEYWILKDSQNNKKLIDRIKYSAYISIASALIRSDSILSCLNTDAVVRIFSLSGNLCFSNVVESIYYTNEESGLSK